MRRVGRRPTLHGTVLIAVAALVVGCASTDVTPTSQAGSASPDAVPGPIGTWAATLSEEDFRAGGITDAPLIAENIGTFTFTVAQDGVWTMAQQASHPVRWPVFRGTWTAPTDGLIVITTDFPEDYAGEFAMLRWSIEDARLHVVVLTPPDPLLKAQWESHPWARSP